MENQTTPDNQDQIIRKDARNCFVEVKNDCFHLDKVHLQFVTYDQRRPPGDRYTNNIHIYIDVPDFLALTQEAANGSLHMRMQQYKAQHKSEALYEHLGGTSAKRLAFYNKARPDGKSLSRVVKLTVAEKADYFFTADCGPGEENKTGLIVPKFGKDPEQHVSVTLTWRQLNELLFTTAAHYNAWLSAKYLSEWGRGTPSVLRSRARRRPPNPRGSGRRSPAKHSNSPQTHRLAGSAASMAASMAGKMAGCAPMTRGFFSGILLLSHHASRNRL